jgi:hypothetical protein
MSRNFFHIVLPLGLLSILAGCKYDGSFMQMDSNSGVPFFGLQLAVDSGSRPPEPGQAIESDENSRYHLPLQDSDSSTRTSRLGEDVWPGKPGLLRVGN